MGATVNYFIEQFEEQVTSSGTDNVEVVLGTVSATRFPYVSASAIHNNANYNIFVDQIQFTSGHWRVKIRPSSGDFPVGTVIHLRVFARC